MRTVSFNTLLTAFAGAARIGRAKLSADEEEQFCADLNAAALWLWEQETHSMALPDMLTGKTITPASGVISADDIENASFWSVWKSDPRLKEPGSERAHLLLTAVGQANGDIRITDSTATSTVYVIYKTPPPQWTIEPASNSKTYDTGDLAECGGKVYRSLIDEASAGDVKDAAVWEEVTLPQSLQRIIVTKANADRIRLGANMPANSQSEELQLAQALDAAFLGAQPITGIKDWLYNQNQ